MYTALLTLWSAQHLPSSQAITNVNDASGAPVDIEDASRLVVLGGSLTEIVFALGAGDRVVGVDASSTYPEAVDQLQKVSYHRRLAAEGVLSLSPTLVIATTEAGPPEALQQLQSAGVTVLILPHEPSAASAVGRIRSLARALDVEVRGEALVQALERDLERAGKTSSDKPVKVLFIYARGQGTLMVAGQETAADRMMELAGGINAVRGYTGYKPLTAEAVVAAAPEAVLVMDSGLESVGGEAGLWKLAGMALTPAGAEGRLVSMNGLLLLGFGPRLGEAAVALNQSLYPRELVQRKK